MKKSVRLSVRMEDPLIEINIKYNKRIYKL